MSITVLNYMDQALVDRIHSQAAKRAETAKQTYFRRFCNRVS